MPRNARPTGLEPKATDVGDNLCAAEEFSGGVLQSSRQECEGALHFSVMRESAASDVRNTEKCKVVPSMFADGCFVPVRRHWRESRSRATLALPKNVGLSRQRLQTVAVSPYAGVGLSPPC